RDRGKLGIKDDSRIRQLFKCLYATHLPNCIKTTYLFLFLSLYNKLFLGSTWIITHIHIYHICIVRVYEDTHLLADDCISDIYDICKGNYRQRIRTTIVDHIYSLLPSGSFFLLYLILM
ncbi:hypothetical protein ALC56_00585, partial [Trachymyrmex septentrionalis]